MPLHLLPLVQLLNIACFLLLKSAYSCQIQRILALARNYINYISKQSFLLASKIAFKKAFIRENACIGF
ncbi:uncharacterized protein M421DRAFT_79463 [Didymella exigua CBS 183.55]|uniref:Secreted protein n=1 Tax=Didymella exigua CBS 183.55 TaxID=1150837 RepID=A0A6A5R4Q7_9PLEO|nr:uncharacterized protein M421DRAFT_79463 [Didymella exigua CBS 183.55]KAF1922138.1 hypothetical protein M421DRAFT_79463 [Didymella exigua CBS 183.55]